MNDVLQRFVYFTILLQVCHCFKTEEYTNENQFEIPQETLRVRMGTNLTLSCYINKNKELYKQFEWEHMPCESNYLGLECDAKRAHDLNFNHDLWKKKASKHLVIRKSNKNHNGIYRCLDKGAIRKIFVIEVISSDASLPEVVSIKTSNITRDDSMDCTILCNVSSKVPPTIVWFKTCNVSKCHINIDETCYCHITSSISSYNISSVYLSKLNLYNIRYIDSGQYVCSVVTEFGTDSKSITINIPLGSRDGYELSLLWLFLIPFGFIIPPLVMWLCWYKRKQKDTKVVFEQQKQLIRWSSKSFAFSKSKRSEI